MIAVPGGLADVERDLIRARASEGRERAKARGQTQGRRIRRRPRAILGSVTRRNLPNHGGGMTADRRIANTASGMDFWPPMSLNGPERSSTGGSRWRKIPPQCHSSVTPANLMTLPHLSLQMITYL